MLIFVQVYKTIDKREQKNQQKGSFKRLKKSAPEVQSALEVMTSSEASSSEAPHQKQYHQKLKFIRRWKILKSWEYDLITSRHCKRLKEYSNGPWDEIWKHWMLVLSRALTKDNCTICITTSSTILFVSLQQDKDNSSSCINVPSYKECIWNWSFIGQ